MTGLVKQKQYDWKDSNLALFGSDTEKQVKKESAMTEEAWKNAGSKVGVQVWRIVKFKVNTWPKEDYGSFYSGDSYIILNTYKEKDSEELLYDVHFWIGSKSTQDEYGTAAYKTVELDTFLDDKPVQHREVQGHESTLFRSYFNNTITILEGGADSGFRHVKPEEYEPRLFHFSGVRKNINIKQVPLSKDRIKTDDVFILDTGKKFFQWNGTGSNPAERNRASTYLQDLRAGRYGRTEVEVLDEGDGDQEFFEFLTAEDEEDDDIPDEVTTKSLLRVSDSDGSIQMEKVKEGHITTDDLDSNDVFVIDTGKECIVWVGRRASPAEKHNGLSYANNYLKDTQHPLVPVSVFKEGQKGRDLQSALAA